MESVSRDSVARRGPRYRKSATVEGSAIRNVETYEPMLAPGMSGKRTANRAASMARAQARIRGRGVAWRSCVSTRGILQRSAISFLAEGLTLKARFEERSRDLSSKRCILGCVI